MSRQAPAADVEGAARDASALEFHVARFDACVADVLAFRNANRSVARDPRYLEWRYRRPCAQPPLIVWARDSAGRPVGAASVIPHDYFVLDGMYPVGLLGDISVLPSQRGRGVAARMLNFLAGDPALRALRACIVLPNAEAQGALARAGWTPVTALRRYVRLLDVGPVVERAFGAHRAARWLAAAGNVGLRAFHWRERLIRTAGYEVRIEAKFDARYDALWRAAAVPGRVLAARDRAYLEWRYAQHPIVKHRVFEICRGGVLEAYLVFHREGNKIAVDDYLGARPDVIDPLFAAFLSWLRRTDEIAMVQIATNAGEAFPLSCARLGFSRRADSQAVMLLDPHPGGASPLAHGPRLHVTAGDKDV